MTNEEEADIEKIEVASLSVARATSIPKQWSSIKDAAGNHKIHIKHGSYDTDGSEAVFEQNPTSSSDRVALVGTEESISGTATNQQQANKESVLKDLDQDADIQQIRDVLSGLASASMVLDSTTPFTMGNSEANRTRWNFNIRLASDDIEILDADETLNIIKYKTQDRRYFTSANLKVVNSSNQDAQFKVQAYNQADDTALALDPVVVDVAGGGGNTPIDVTIPVDVIVPSAPNLEFYYGLWSDNDSANITINQAIVQITSGSGAVTTDADIETILTNGDNANGKGIQNLGTTTTQKTISQFTNPKEFVPLEFVKKDKSIITVSSYSDLAKINSFVDNLVVFVTSPITIPDGGTIPNEPLYISFLGETINQLGNASFSVGTGQTVNFFCPYKVDSANKTLNIIGNNVKFRKLRGASIKFENASSTDCTVIYEEAENTPTRSDTGTGITTLINQSWDTPNFGGGVATSPYYFGSMNAVDVNTAISDGGTVFLLACISPRNVTVEELDVYVTSTASDSIEMAIYTRDISTGDFSQVATTGLASVNPTSGGILTLLLAGPPIGILAKQTYWLAYKSSNGSINVGGKSGIFQGGSNPIAYSKFLGSSDLPATITGASSSGSAVYVGVRGLA